MNKKSSIVKKIEKNLENSPKLEIVLSLFKSLLSLSIIGSPISVLISDFIPSRRLLRLESFAEELSDEFKEIEEKIDAEFITTDEFAYLFEQCFKAASENYQKEKISAFKAILINATIDKTIIPLEKEFFLNLTKQLTVLHIQILTFLKDPNAYIKNAGLSEDQIQGSYKHSLPKIFPNIDFDTIKIVMDDLNNYGLTNYKSRQSGGLGLKIGFQFIGDRGTTTFGDKYLRFITL